MTSSATQKHLFYVEMAKLLDAGFDIRKAAAVLNDSQLPPAQAALLKDLNQGLNSGENIASAFGRDQKNISDLERSIIGAGERGGKLAPAFQHLADYFGMLASVRSRMIRGMIYPLVVLHLGIVIGTVPTALMREESTGKIYGNLLVTLGAVYLTGFVLYLIIRAILKLAPDQPAIDAAINRIPWIGSTRRNLAMARFCRVYHSCILAGIPMIETVRNAADASHSGVIRNAGNALVGVAIQGYPLGPQFVALDAFPKPFSRSYLTGEEAGTLDKDLARWSKVFQDDSQSAAATMSVMVPKVLYFIIMIFVAWKIVSFFNGYYSGMDQLME